VTGPRLLTRRTLSEQQAMHRPRKTPKTYPLADTAEGLRYVEQGHARGKAVVTVA
jgi:hypothetical protein